MHCPICKREFDRESSPALPFCSERCRTIDLGRWLGEDYSVPVTPDPDADEFDEDGGVSENGNGAARHP
jgi:endogenous inhibitor of DNA gyrase (YacG/DUF329 family)